MKLLNEELYNMKYLFGYKPGKVISEQDNVPTEIRRRMPEISQKFDEMIDSPDNSPNDFYDEFQYADNIISWTLDELFRSTNDIYYIDNMDDVTDFIKEMYGDSLFDRWYSEANDDDDYEDDDDDYEDDEEEDVDN
jgi:hypothetical protein